MKDQNIQAAEKAIRRICAEYGVSLESVNGPEIILRRESIEGTKRVKCVIAAL